MQVSTQRYDRRPYGVGLLIAGYDENGPHIYQTCPSANYFECKSMAIGARSQSARTYLEKHLDSFFDTTLEQLVRHGLLALRECLPNDLEMNTKNVSISIVGEGHPFTIYDDDDVEEWLNLVRLVILPFPYFDHFIASEVLFLCISHLTVILKERGVEQDQEQRTEVRMNLVNQVKESHPPPDLQSQNQLRK